MKKVLSVILVLAMMLALGVTCYADGTTETGSVTITGTTENKVYDLYRIFDLTYEPAASEGGDPTVAYTIASGWDSFFSGDGAAYIVDEDTTGTLNQIVIDGEVKYINITDSNVADFAQDALAFCAATSSLIVDTATGDGSDVTVDDLPLGYYLVYPEGATDDANPCICSLDSTLPDASVSVKAKYPEIVKTFADGTDIANGNIGDSVDYKITGVVPDTTGYSKYVYTITDTLSTGLTYNDDIVITFDGTDVTAQAEEITSDETGFVATFDMTKFQNYVGKAILVTYSATINADVELKPAVGNPNSATLDYSHDPKTPTDTDTTPPEVVKVYSYGIVIDKYDANDPDVKLEGAKFVLKNSDEKYYAYDSTTEKTTWVANIADATEVVTDDTGAASFLGIAAGTYYLVETDHPKGYNLLTEPQKVVISADTVSDAGTLTAEVPNNGGVELPSTGGMGVTVFYVFGTLMLMGFAALLIYRRKTEA